MPDAELMNYLVRMVIPVKREFGRTLDVQKFLIDRPYAVEVIQEAMRSRDPRLQAYAAYVGGKVFGPRGTAAPPLRPPAEAADPVDALFEPESGTGAVTVDELHRRRLDKYQSGLR